MLVRGLWLRMAKGLKIEITGLRSFEGLDKEVASSVRESMDVIRMDVVRVSSGLAPVDKGHLENSYKETITNTNTKSEFEVSYAAYNKGFNYAEWTHNEDYNLGKKSRLKRPAKSRFTKATFKVGKGYLHEVAIACKDGWTDFINAEIDKAVDKAMKRNSKK